MPFFWSQQNWRLFCRKYQEFLWTIPPCCWSKARISIKVNSVLFNLSSTLFLILKRSILFMNSILRLRWILCPSNFILWRQGSACFFNNSCYPPPLFYALTIINYPQFINFSYFFFCCFCSWFMNKYFYMVLLYSILV